MPLASGKIVTLGAAPGVTFPPMQRMHSLRPGAATGGGGRS
jgi:hypothetical protein